MLVGVWLQERNREARAESSQTRPKSWFVSLEFGFQVFSVVRQVKIRAEGVQS